MSVQKTMRAFSMIELIFVVVILGIIASIAIPKISLTRSDAQFVAIKADLQNIISALQQKFITQDISTATLNGQLIMDTAGLSQSRWVVSGNGVRLGKNGVVDSGNNCVLVEFQQTSLVVSVDASVSSTLCQKLAKEYPKPVTTNLEGSALSF